MDKIDHIVIFKADIHHVNDIRTLLIRSITDVCGPDYNNDKETMNEWLANKTVENISIWIKTTNYSYIAINSLGNIIGFILMNNHGEILLNYVLPEYLYMGVGKTLLNHLESSAAKNKIKTITVNSTITAKTFYEKNGYVKNGKPIYVGSILGEFPLRKDLLHTLDKKDS